MRTIASRAAALAFPASGIVILTAYAVQLTTSTELPAQVTAAATGLLTWAAAVLLGAGTKQS